MSRSPSHRVAEVAANVRAAVARRGIRQTAIGEALELDQRAVSRRMRGSVAWSLFELEELARFLDVDLEYLLRAEVAV